MRLFFIITFSAVALAGCSSKFKQRMGIHSSAPNEYKVFKEKSLEVPPRYDLPPPAKD